MIGVFSMNTINVVVIFHNFKSKSHKTVNVLCQKLLSDFA